MMEGDSLVTWSMGIIFLPLMLLSLFWNFLQNSKSCNEQQMSLASLKVWSWLGDDSGTNGWGLSMKQWRKIVVVNLPITKALHRRWSIVDRRVLWQPALKALETRWGIHRARLIAWRALHHSYFTNARGAIWGVTQNICLVCNQPRESIQHMFFECDAMSRRWIVIEARVKHLPL